jgi:hypothetical protein
MKALLVGALVIGGLFPYAVHAQRGGSRGGGAVGQPGRGGARGGGAVGQPGFGFGRMAGGKFGVGRFGGRNQRGGFGGFGFRGLGFGGLGFGGLGFGGLGYGWDLDYGSGFGGYPFYEGSWFPKQYGSEGQASPGVMLMQAPPPPLPPPEPARPAMQIYHWAETGANPQAIYSIVSRDGVVRHAVAVWVQDNEVRYTAANGAAGRVGLAAIDCGATGRLNAEQQLSLRLPGCTSQ